MSFDHEHFARTVQTVRAVGLHKIAGEMTGVGEMTAPIAAGIIGAKAYERRKAAQLVASGVASLAAVEKQAMSPELAATLRGSIIPAIKGG